MLLRDLSFPSPRENILFDDVLFSLADKGGDIEYLRFWESPRYFVVLGRIGREEDDVNAGQAGKDGIDILRRSSGGGTVVQGPGCLNYAFVLNKDKRTHLNDLRASYEWISTHIIASLAGQGIKAGFRPISDIAVIEGDKKFSGNAQRRGKTHILHHGTILIDFDLDLISTYLQMPKDVPEYRKMRGHKDFVTNIPIDREIFKKELALRFGIDDFTQAVSPEESSALKKLLK